MLYRQCSSTPFRRVMYCTILYTYISEYLDGNRAVWCSPHSTSQRVSRRRALERSIGLSFLLHGNGRNGVFVTHYSDHRKPWSPRCLCPAYSGRRLRCWLFCRSRRSLARLLFRKCLRTCQLLLFDRLWPRPSAHQSIPYIEEGLLEVIARL